ncbi:MAG: serine hydrolase, partial [bacterium]|nr:serine hydrolase [bacterium]
PELEQPGAERITLAHLLGHASGFPAHIRFYERLLADRRPGTSGVRERMLRMVCQTELLGSPGERIIYSDLGYILLGFAIERLTDRRLDQAVAELVTGPLGMSSTFFVDLAEARSDTVPRGRIAPTEVCPYRGLVHGEVHDDNAHAGGGIFGHAGLFSCAGDVATFARAMVTVLCGHAVAGLRPEVVRRFTSARPAPGTTWSLGWDRPAPLPEPSHAGDLWPRDG